MKFLFTTRNREENSQIDIYIVMRHCDFLLYKSSVELQFKQVASDFKSLT